MKKKILFIVNPKSGTGRYKRVPERVEEYLDKEKFDYEIRYTEYKGHATEMSKKAVNDKIDIVVAVGGDGTINEVVTALVGTDVILGILATGSGNGLAHHLRIPSKLKKAIAIFNEEYFELIDTVSLNDKVYASIAGVGYDAFVAEKFSHTKHRGLIPYVHYAVVNYLSYKPKTYIFEGDKSFKIKALLVSFANSSQWGFNIKISQEASVQDGWVNVSTIKKPPLFMLPHLVLFLLSGNLNRVDKYVKMYKLQHFTLEAEGGNELHTHIDGDFLTRQKKIEVQVHPQSLKIALKRNY